VKYLLCVVVMLLLPGVLLAEPPKAVLSGPTGGVPGDIIVLDASASTAKFMKWVVSPKLTGGRQNIMEFEQGRKAVLASLPGQYTVTLIAANEDGIDIVEYAVTITGPQPVTPQPIVPNPIVPQPITPQPSVPEPTLPSPLGFSRLAYMAAREIGNKPEAIKLATAYRGIASKIVARGTTGQADIFASLKAANAASLGSQERVTAWKPVLGVALPKQFQVLQDAGTKLTDDVFAAAFLEIAVGFETFGQ
jgi:hypothetical protein